MPNVIPTVETPISRQYIGARYVPIFDGAWDNTKDYAPLTVVSYEGNSYTSRTYVPSGIDITNETYWALSGNYNAQVEAYRQEVADFKSDLENRLSDDEISTAAGFNSVNKQLEGIITHNATVLTNYGQDSAEYNGKLFTFNSSGHYKVYDIESGEQLASLDLDGAYVPHANAVSFGKKINESDAFPPIYITGYNGTDGTDPLPKGTCIVYKVNADYSTELLQVITISFTNDVSLWGTGSSADGAYTYGDFVVDPEHEKLYAITSIKDYRICTRIFEFNLPPTTPSSISLLAEDVITYFDVPLYPVLQGIAYHNGRLYILNGDDPYECINIVDISSKTQEGSYNISSFMIEPEAVFFYEGKIYVADDTIYKLSDIPTFSSIGNLNKLITNNRSSLVDAINEVAAKMGSTNLIPLTTETLTKRGLDCVKNATTGLVEITGEYDESSTTAFIFALGSVTLPAGKYHLQGNSLSNEYHNLSIQCTFSGGTLYDLGLGVDFELDEEKSVSFQIYYPANLDVGVCDIVFVPECFRYL